MVLLKELFTSAEIRVYIHSHIQALTWVHLHESCDCSFLLLLPSSHLCTVFTAPSGACSASGPWSSRDQYQLGAAMLLQSHIHPQRDSFLHTHSPVGVFNAFLDTQH